MKADIHPNYHPVTVSCACGSVFTTRSTIHQDTIRVEVCNACHPFYTGKHKIVDTEGRVDAFMRRYARGGKPADADKKADEK